jgi:hypothetical protein
VRWLEESFLRGSDLMTYDEPALDGPTTPTVCSSQNIGEGIPADIPSTSFEMTTAPTVSFVDRPAGLVLGAEHRLGRPNDMLPPQPGSVMGTPGQAAIRITTLMIRSSSLTPHRDGAAASRRAYPREALLAR